MGGRLLKLLEVLCPKPRLVFRLDALISLLKGEGGKEHDSYGPAFFFYSVKLSNDDHKKLECSRE